MLEITRQSEIRASPIPRRTQWGNSAEAGQTFSVSYVTWHKQWSNVCSSWWKIWCLKSTWLVLRHANPERFGHRLSCHCRTLSCPPLQRKTCQRAQGVQNDLHGQGTDPSTAVLGSAWICQRQPLSTADPGFNNWVFYGGVRGRQDRVWWENQDEFYTRV